jgi:hypothetical protein
MSRNIKSILEVAIPSFASIALLYCATKFKDWWFSINLTIESLCNVESSTTAQLSIVFSILWGVYVIKNKSFVDEMQLYLIFIVKKCSLSIFCWNHYLLNKAFVISKIYSIFAHS